MNGRFRFCLRAAALSALLVMPAVSAALAQMPNINLVPELKSRTPEEKERDEKNEKAYRESLRKIPDNQTANDPWGNVRGAEAGPKAAAKPKPAPQKQTKASGSAN